MLSYTITKGGSYITNEVILKRTESVTEAIDACGKNATATTIGITEFKQNSNGNYSSIIQIKYQDNGPGRCPGVDGIGGYNRCNRSELKWYTYYKTNGEMTYAGPKTSTAEITCPKGEVDVTILNIPVKEEVTYQTTTITNSNVNYFTTTKTNFFETWSFYTVNSTKIEKSFYSTQYTFNTRKNSNIKRKTTSFKKSIEIIGYQDKDELKFAEVTPFNYLQTVYVITNTNILWHCTNYQFPANSTVNLEEFFTSDSKIDKEVTVSFIKPKLIQGRIGQYNCSSFDENFDSQKAKQEIISDTKNFTFVTTNKKNFAVTKEISPNVIPLSTSNEEIQFNTTHVDKKTTKVYTKYSSVRTTIETRTVLSNFKAKAENLNWDCLFYSTDTNSINDINNYKYSTHGECKLNNQTIKDFAFYKYVNKCSFYLYPNAGLFTSFNPEYLDGQVAASNLTSFRKQAVLENNKTFLITEQSLFKAWGTSYGISVLPNIIIPVHQLIPTYKADQDNKTLNFSDMSVLKVSFTTLSKGFTRTSTTEYKWQGIGNNDTTYFRNLPGGKDQIFNLNNLSIGDPNVIYESSKNFGQNRDDSKGTISRFLSPGTFMVIKSNGDQYGTFVNDSPNSFNNQDYYLGNAKKLAVGINIGAHISTVEQRGVRFSSLLNAIAFEENIVDNEVNLLFQLKII